MAGGGQPGKVLPSLLSPGHKLQVCRSTSVDSPYFMEPDYRANSRIWDDSLLRRGDYSEYLLGGYDWTSVTSTRDFHLGHISVEGPYTRAAGHNLSYGPPIGRGKWLKATLSMRGLVPQVPQSAPASRQLPPLPWGQPATPYQQVVQPLSKTSGLRVTFDSSATKPASPSSQDIDVHGRQVTQGRDGDRQSASCPGRGWEGSSIRETSNWMPCQEGGHPTRAPRNIPSSSTPGKPSPQPGGIMKASPGNLLKNITNYRSAGWRKDLDHILRSFYNYNYPSHKEEEWKKLKTKFFEYLGQHQEEWRISKKISHSSTCLTWRAASTPSPASDSRD